jgi:hypothetical protein
MSATPLVISPTQHRARTFAEALFSGLAGPPPASRLDWLVTEVADLLHYAGTRSRWMFQICMFFASWLAPLWIFRLPPLRRLSVADRVRALTKMEDSQTFSPLVLACKTVLCMIYYEDEGAAREIGAYEPCEPAHRRLPRWNVPPKAVSHPAPLHLDGAQ